MSDAPRTDALESDHRGTLVVLGGSFTTLLALAGVFAAQHHGENIMGWYANYVLPAGAILVGLVAASGYGIVAWVTGLKMTRALLASVMAELALSYVLAHYQEYWQLMGDSSLSGFFAWFDASTRAFAWNDHGHIGEPLGALGYGLRALELAGFVGGGAAVPLILRSKPYCDPCRTYKRTRQLIALPAGVTPKMFGRVDKEANNEAWKGAQEAMRAIFSAADKGDRALLAQEMTTRSIANRAAAKLHAHATVSLVRCPRCADGGLVATMVTGRGRQIKRTRMGDVALPAERVRMLFD